MRKEVDKLIRNWNVVLASIAAISLLVGGIGTPRSATRRSS